MSELVIKNNNEEVVENKKETNVEYEHVDHPAHYNNYDIEVIEMMRRIWGDESTMLWCEMTAFKYRMRMGTKLGNTIKQDLDKEKWYLKKKKELLSEFEKEIDNWTETSYIKPISNNDNNSISITTLPETFNNDDYVSSVTTNADVSAFFTSTATQVDYITPINLEKNNN